MSPNVTTITHTSFSWSRLFLSLGWAPIAVFFIHQFSVWATRGEYWWDEIMHVAGGMAIAWMGCVALKKLFTLGVIPRLPRWFLFLTLIGFVMIAGVVWEWYEYIRWLTFDPTMDLTLPDTLKDLVMDTLGGLLIALQLHERKGG